MGFTELTVVPKSAKKPRQVEAFRKAARELGCDDSEDRFQAALRTIAKHKPKDDKKAPKRR